MKINIGKHKIQQESEATLLGIKFNESQNWKTHIFGKGGMISSLN